MVITVLCSRIGNGKRDILKTVCKSNQGYFYDCLTRRHYGDPAAKVQCFADIDTHLEGPSFLWDKIDTLGLDMRYVLSCTSLEMAGKIKGRYTFADIIYQPPETFTSVGKLEPLYWSEITLASLRVLYNTFRKVCTARDSRSRYINNNALFGNYVCFIRELALKLDPLSKIVTPFLVNEFVTADKAFGVLDPKVHDAYYDLLVDNQLAVDNLVYNGKTILIPTVEFISVAVYAVRIRPEIRKAFEVLSYICTFYKGPVVFEDGVFTFGNNTFRFDTDCTLYLNGEKAESVEIMKFMDTSAI